MLVLEKMMIRMVKNISKNQVFQEIKVQDMEIFPGTRADDIGQIEKQQNIERKLTWTRNGS